MGCRVQRVDWDEVVDKVPSRSERAIATVCAETLSSEMDPKVYPQAPRRHSLCCTTFVLKSISSSWLAGLQFLRLLNTISVAGQLFQTLQVGELDRKPHEPRDCTSSCLLPRLSIATPPSDSCPLQVTLLGTPTLALTLYYTHIALSSSVFHPRHIDVRSISTLHLLSRRTQAGHQPVLRAPAPYAIAEQTASLACRRRRSVLSLLSWS